EPMYPTVGSLADCCACAVSGHAAEKRDKFSPPHGAYPRLRTGTNHSTVRCSKKRRVRSELGHSRALPHRNRNVRCTSALSCADLLGLSQALWSARQQVPLFPAHGGLGGTAGIITGGTRDDRQPLSFLLSSELPKIFREFCSESASPQ